MGVFSSSFSALEAGNSIPARRAVKALIALAALLLALGAASSSAVAFTGARAAAMPGRVYVQGDSLTVDSSDYLRLFTSPSVISISARIGRHTSTGVAAIAAAKRWLPGAVVVALGTNDDTDSWGVRAFRTQVSRALSILGPSRCIIWVDMFQMPKKGYRGDPLFAPLNRVLEAAARTHGNLRILHWSMLSSRNTAWYRYDPIHPTDAGYRTRAREIAHALGGCPRQTRALPWGSPSGGPSGGTSPG